MSNTDSPHIPVMLTPVLEHLALQPGDVVVDCTFGAGGYSRAMLQETDCRVIAIDRDPNVRSVAEDLKKEFAADRFHFALTEFSQIQSVIQSFGYKSVNAVVADFGLSSMQLDDGSRGFSFRYDAPLDMRMSPDKGEGAAAILAQLDEAEMRRIFRDYGEERYAGRIAAAIQRARQENPIETTWQLADIARSAVPAAYAHGALHPATRVFQALRIHVNQELAHIETLMQCVPQCLEPGGRFVCVSFHSLEDATVKRFLKQGHEAAMPLSRYVPEMPDNDAKVIWSKISKKALQPTDIECQNNPRARSAKLRWAFRS